MLDHRVTVFGPTAGQWHVVGDGRARAHHRAFADRHTAQDRGVRPDACSLPNEGGNDLPVADPEESSRVVHRRGIAVVGEADMRADEDTVLDRHAGRDEGKGLHLDPPTKHRSALNLDERGDLALGADLAAVHVHQLGVEDNDVLAQLDVGCDQGRSPPDSRLARMSPSY